MTFVQSIKKCMTNYVKTNGRSSRSEFLWWMVFVILFSIIIIVLDRIVRTSSIMIILLAIYTLVVPLPTFALVIRRYHDTNHSGWWMFCPFYGTAIFFTPSDPISNDYGDPEHSLFDELGI